jgi:hypothetical protein
MKDKLSLHPIEPENHEGRGSFVLKGGMLWQQPGKLFQIRRLYGWSSAVADAGNGRDVCPAGGICPAREDWDTVADYAFLPAKASPWL